MIKVEISERVTMDGFTYQPGTYNVTAEVAEKLLHNYPDTIREVKATKKATTKKLD